MTATDRFNDSPFSSAEATTHVVRATRQNTAPDPDNDLPPAATGRTLRTILCADGSLTTEQFRYAARRAADRGDLLIYQTERGYHFSLANPDHLVALAEQWADARHHRSARDRLQQLIETVADLETLDSAETQTVVAAANRALDDLPD